MTGVSPLDASGLLAALSDAGIDFGAADAERNPARHGGVEFGELAVESVEDEVFGHKVRFCSYKHLIAMKEGAGRSEDLLDLERLRQARGE